MTFWAFDLFNINDLKYTKYSPFWNFDNLFIKFYLFFQQC